MPDPSTTAPADPSQVTPPAAPAAPAAAAAAAAAAPGTPPQAQPTLLSEPPKAGAGQPAAPAPEEIKLKYPEGVSEKDPFMGKFLTIAKEIGLKSDGAQKLVDLQAEVMAQAQTSHMEQVTQWAEESKADTEIGGDKFQATLTLANKALDRIAPPGFRELLTKTGLGNHKDVIKTFAQVGKLISEDRLPGGGNNGAAGPSREDLIREAYPNSPSMWAK